jgi:hypothetical protein
MRRAGQVLGRAAFAGAVALALGFGAREAVASPARARAVVYCSNKADCQAYCDSRYVDAVGVCSVGHTCSCFFP